MSIEDEQAKHEAQEQYAMARDHHAEEAADLLAHERIAWWCIEIGAAEMLAKRMFEELEADYGVVWHG